ncbi:MAG: hypothetical protein AAF170_18215 [Bacteroidota bacterium]
MMSPTAIARALTPACLPLDAKGHMKLGPGLIVRQPRFLLRRLQIDLAETGIAGYGPRSLMRTAALNRLRLVLAARRHALAA